MQIVERDIGSLVPYENNPRHNEDAVKFVAASIKEFGFKVPVVIDEKSVIVAGHTRVLAAKELGIEKIPCIVASDRTEEQVRAFRLADNKVSEASSWNWDKLDEELAKLPDFDMGDFGFADTQAIEWAKTPELSESSYEEPEKVRLICPHCGHVAGKEFFKKA